MLSGWCRIQGSGNNFDDGSAGGEQGDKLLCSRILNPAPSAYHPSLPPPVCQGTSSPLRPAKGSLPS